MIASQSLGALWTPPYAYWGRLPEQNFTIQRWNPPIEHNLVVKWWLYIESQRAFLQKMKKAQHSDWCNHFQTTPNWTVALQFEWYSQFDNLVWCVNSAIVELNLIHAITFWPCWPGQSYRGDCELSHSIYMLCPHTHKIAMLWASSLFRDTDAQTRCPYRITWHS